MTNTMVPPSEASEKDPEFPPAPIQVVAHNVVVERPRPSRRLASVVSTRASALQSRSNSMPTIAAILLGAALVVGGFFLFTKARGPHIVSVSDPTQKVYLFSLPDVGSFLIGKAEQGESCEIVESVIVGGGRWYHVRVHGAEGWTQMVTE